MVVKSNNCTFCKIINKEVDSYTLFENEKILAFLDIDPISKGHTLIIPKKHYKDISDTPKDTLTKIMLAAKKVSKDLLSIFNYDSVTILQNNGHAQDCKHFHLHVFGRDRKNDVKFIWPKLNKISNEEMKIIAKKLSYSDK